MRKFTPNRPVFSHSQDGAVDCGRASVQMVIASLVLGAPTGRPPSPRDGARPIPFTQDDVRRREQFPHDDVTVVAWRTHPDELLQAMRTAPELTGTLANWRLVVEHRLDDLLYELTQALRAGMPAIVNVYPFDHWVVVVGVGVQSRTSEILFVEVLDPLPQGGVVHHTYVDACSARFEGLSLVNVETFDPHQLANLDLEVGDIPPPGRLENYAGKYVALVHAGRRRRSAKRWQPKRPQRRARDATDGSATTARLPLDIARDGLKQKASEWGISPLRELLDGELEYASILVRDVEGQRVPYHLTAMFNGGLGYGVVAAFDTRDAEPLHFRFTANMKLVQTITARNGQTLWWTRRPLATLQSPYFPFGRQVSGSKTTYTRLFDGFAFELDAQS